MKTGNLALLAILCICLAGCDKNEIERKPVIMVGEFEGMIINTWDTIISGGYYSPAFFELDMDNDGIFDIKFQSVVTGSPGMGQIPSSKLISLHENAEILGFFTDDTIFKNRVIKINDQDYPVVITEIIKYGCIRISNTDEITSIRTSFKILPLDFGDIFGYNDSFSSEDFVLSSGSFSYYTADNLQDTVYVYQVIHLSNCNYFPPNEKYIGVLINNEESKLRLGWIKIELSGHSINIFQSGIQK